MSIRREVLDFLLDHRGWIKKSPKDLHRRLYNLGIDVSMDAAAGALMSTR